MDETKLRVDPLIDIGVDAKLLGMESLGSVNVKHGDRYKSQSHFHVSDPLGFVIKSEPCI